MYMLKVIVLVMMLLIPCFVLGQTQGEMEQGACDESKRADADLNREYQQLLHQYRDDVRFIRNARRAQRAWIAYRDAQSGLLYPYAERRGAYGSVYPMCRCMAVLELTKKRVEELRRWVDGVEEGDVCSGSIKIRNHVGWKAKPTRNDKSTNTNSNRTTAERVKNSYGAN